MVAILSDVKVLLETDTAETIYDDELILHINGGLAYLANNGVPVAQIEKTDTAEVFENLSDADYQIVIQWLHLSSLVRFDMAILNSATLSGWLQGEMQNLLYQLKAVYDV